MWLAHSDCMIVLLEICLQHLFKHIYSKQLQHRQQNVHRVNIYKSIVKAPLSGSTFKIRVFFCSVKCCLLYLYHMLLLWLASSFLSKRCWRSSKWRPAWVCISPGRRTWARQEGCTHSRSWSSSPGTTSSPSSCRWRRASRAGPPGSAPLPPWGSWSCLVPMETPRKVAHSVEVIQKNVFFLPCLLSLKASTAFHLLYVFVCLYAWARFRHFLFVFCHIFLWFKCICVAAIPCLKAKCLPSCFFINGRWCVGISFIGICGSM